MSEALVRPLVEPFHSLQSPTRMKQLALVAHNHMKPAMHDFIIQYGEILRKFRVTGTETTMSICMREWKDKEGVSSFLAETIYRLDLVASKGDRLSRHQLTPSFRRLLSQVVYGETCTSGPLGGDAEISSSLVRGDIGAGKKSSRPHCSRALKGKSGRKSLYTSHVSLDL